MGMSKVTEDVKRYCAGCEHWDSSADRPRMWTGICWHIASDSYQQLADAHHSCPAWTAATDWRPPPRRIPPDLRPAQPQEPQR